MDNIFDTLQEFFANIGSRIAFDYLLFIAVGLLVVLICAGLIMSRCSYQAKLLRTCKHMNAYLVKNPQINESNLIEFNNRMKRVPKQVRTGWMQYILARKESPSHYISTENCVDQQSRGNSYGNLISVTSILLGIIVSVCFLFGIAFYANDVTTSVGRILFYITIIPILVGVIGYLFISFLKLNQNRLVENLYYQFTQFQKNMDAACKTLPMFVDPELLFTQREIKSGDPVVTAYLNKKEELEQKEAEERRLNEQQFEQYNFDDLGIENALLLEKAMKESEKYLSVKYDFEDKIRGKEDEMYSYTAAFDEVTKTYERKAQARREAIEQLNNQINASTIAAETTFLRNRAAKENEQLNIIEADYQSARDKYQKQQETVEKEIEGFQNEIAKRKKIVEDNMREQGRTYANQIYGEISKTVMEQNKPYFEQMEAKKQELEDQVKELQDQLNTEKATLESTQQQLAQVNQDVRVKQAEIDAMDNVKTYFTSEAFLESVNDIRNKQNKFNEIAQENAKIRQDLNTALNANKQLESQLKVATKSAVRSQELDARVKDLNERERNAIAKERQINALLKQLEDAKNEIIELKADLDQEQQSAPRQTQPKASKTENTSKNIAKLQALNEQIDEENERLDSVKKTSKRTAKINKSLTNLVDAATKVSQDKK